MGAHEDRINQLTESRAEAKRWVAARLRTTPEPLEPPYDEDTMLGELRDELEGGSTDYMISIHANEDGFLAMTPEDIAEQLLQEVAEVLKWIRLERRLLENPPAEVEELTGEALIAALEGDAA